MTKRIESDTVCDMAERINAFDAFLASPEGARFLARRVLMALGLSKEQLRLDAWLKARMIFSASSQPERI